MSRTHRVYAHIFVIDVWLYIAHDYMVFTCHKHTQSMSHVHVTNALSQCVMYVSPTSHRTESTSHAHVSQSHQGTRQYRAVQSSSTHANAMPFTCHTRTQSMGHVHVAKAINQSRELTEHMHI